MLLAKRHLAKSVTWRILASADTFLISWLVTGQVEWAAGIVSIEFISKFVLYYIHERVWYKKIKYGIEYAVKPDHRMD